MIDLKKWSTIQEQTVAEQGEFYLFGLFRRENGIGLWDFVVAAPWIGADRKTALDYLSKKLSKTLSRDELLSISRIVILEPNNPALKQLRSRARREGKSIVELHNVTLFGLEMEHAYVFTGRTPKPKLARRTK